MRKIKGVTLISLIITISVLIILATTAITSGISLINSSNMTTFTAEMKIMQTQVNSLYEEKTDFTTIGQELEGEYLEQAKRVFTEDESGLSDYSGYKYWSTDVIKSLGIEGVEQDFFVNGEKRSIVSYKGIEYEGKRYYTLNQLPENLYNVEYNENNDKPTFEIDETEQRDNEYKIKIYNIQYSGYIKKWQVKYKLEGQSYWSTSDDLEFIVNMQGKYIIQIENGNIKSDEQEYTVIASGANHPVLKDGMQAITYDENGNSIPVPEDKVSGKTWYSYEITDDGDLTHGGTDTWNEDTKEWGKSHWANATLDGNYYVWIPRYAYKIDKSVEYTSQQGNSYKIDVKFLSGTSSDVEEGYTVHPAFTFGEQQLEGIWVGKYKTTGTKENPTILPNEKSLTNITVAEMFSTSQKLSKTNIDAHMSKNIEWGAVAYLAQSQYGRNGTEVSVNQCAECYTGAGRGIGTETDNPIYNSTYTWSNINDSQKYNGKIGKLSSTTGNIYGVYDISGGAWGYVMGFYGTAENTPVFGSTGFSNAPERKYYDLYLNTSADESNIGDALYETEGWNNDDSYFVYSDHPIFIRGRNSSSSKISGNGIFSFASPDGRANPYNGFLVCLAVENNTL